MSRVQALIEVLIDELSRAEGRATQSRKCLEQQELLRALANYRIKHEEGNDA